MLACISEAIIRRSYIGWSEVRTSQEYSIIAALLFVMLLEKSS